MTEYIIKEASIINEETIQVKDVWIKNGRIHKIDNNLSSPNTIEIIANGQYLIPGVIDDQVHFREPGLTHKANIYTESRAAVAGGTTTFMEMPNTKPSALTQDLLEEKYTIASKNSLANYSFFMGVSNENLEEVLKTNDKKNDVCGIKIFMGSSTGNMLVDNFITLDKIFSSSELLIATHCENEKIIEASTQKLLQELPKEEWQAYHHPILRNEEACFESSFAAVQLAKMHNTRLHILHISTKKELQLFSNMLPLKDKKITAEVCVHHLTFDADDYAKYNNLIKCNPAIKAPNHKENLWKALLDDTLDIVATDHAPHTWDEKQQLFHLAPSGIPLVQHSLYQMLEHSKNGKLSLEKLVRKMCHAPADCFQIKDRGYIKEGYFADLVLINPNENYTVNKENILYKCAWSPFENKTFSHRITHTFVNGTLAFHNDEIIETNSAMRLAFDRN